MCTVSCRLRAGSSISRRFRSTRSWPGRLQVAGLSLSRFAPSCRSRRGGRYAGPRTHKARRDPRSTTCRLRVPLWPIDVAGQSLRSRPSGMHNPAAEIDREPRRPASGPSPLLLAQAATHRSVKSSLSPCWVASSSRADRRVSRSVVCQISSTADKSAIRSRSAATCAARTAQTSRSLFSEASGIKALLLRGKQSLERGEQLVRLRRFGEPS